MRYLLFILFLFSSEILLAQRQFVVDPNAEVRAVSGSFTSISVSAGMHVYLSRGDEEAIAISATDEKYKQGIKTEITNGELHIFYSGDRPRYGNDSKMSVYIAYKALEQISATGASDIYLAGTMNLPLLNLHLTGASSLKGDINIKELNIKLTGASELKLSGKAGAVNIESTGASDVKAYELTAQNCNIKVSGASLAGELQFTCTRQLYV